MTKSEAAYKPIDTSEPGRPNQGSDHLAEYRVGQTSPSKPASSDTKNKEVENILKDCSVNGDTLSERSADTDKDPAKKGENKDKGAENNEGKSEKLTKPLTPLEELAHKFQEAHESKDPVEMKKVLGLITKDAATIWKEKGEEGLNEYAAKINSAQEPDSKNKDKTKAIIDGPFRISFTVNPSKEKGNIDIAVHASEQIQTQLVLGNNRTLYRSDGKTPAKVKVGDKDHQHDTNLLLDAFSSGDGTAIFSGADGTAVPSNFPSLIITDKSGNPILATTCDGEKVPGKDVHYSPHLGFVRDIAPACNVSVPDSANPAAAKIEEESDKLVKDYPKTRDLSEPQIAKLKNALKDLANGDVKSFASVLPGSSKHLAMDEDTLKALEWCLDKKGVEVAWHAGDPKDDDPTNILVIAPKDPNSEAASNGRPYEDYGLQFTLKLKGAQDDKTAMPESPHIQKALVIHDKDEQNKAYLRVAAKQDVSESRRSELIPSDKAQDVDAVSNAVSATIINGLKPGNAAGIK